MDAILANPVDLGGREVAHSGASSFLRPHLETQEKMRFFADTLIALSGRVQGP
jgi:hypothetical protein